MEGNKASAHLEGQFEVIGVVPGNVVLKDNTTVDLRTISLEKANELYESGFPYLKKIVKQTKIETPAEEIKVVESTSDKAESSNTSNRNNSKK